MFNQKFGEPPNEYYEKPDYLNDDAAAMSLLDMLVEKGLEPDLFYSKAAARWGFTPDITDHFVTYGATRREAVVAAVLELIGKENV